MRIGLFLSSLPGFSETFILSKIHSLIEEGHEVAVFLANASDEKVSFRYVNPYKRDKVSFVFYLPWVLFLLFFTKFSVTLKFVQLEKSSGKKGLYLLKSIYINAHLLLAERLDWLHFTFATFAIGRENVAEAIGAKMAVSLRGFDIGIYPLKNPHCYSLLWKKVNKVHSISDDLYAQALKHGLSSKAAYQKIRPAISVSRLLRKKNLGDIKDPCVIISVGRLEWKKGFIYALLAMQELKRRGVAFIYKIVGSGSIEEELKFAIYDLDIGDRVILEGRLTHDEIFRFLQEADIYVQPSVQEGFCNSLVEAQGTGLLCIATTAEGLQENVLHEKTGWIVEKRNHRAIAEAIERIIKLMPDERTRVAQQAVKRVALEFDLKRLKKEFTHFYTG